MDVGPQVNVPVGNALSGGVSGWQGMTIKDILEKVDLFNITTLVGDEEKKLKDTKASLMMTDTKGDKSSSILPAPNSAFLGPKIWKKPLNFYKMGNNTSTNNVGAEFSVMNIDEFLNENNFDVGRISPPLAEDMFDQRGMREGTPYTNEAENGPLFSLHDIEMDSEQQIESPPGSVEMPGSPSSGFEMRALSGTFPQPSDCLNKNKNELPKGGNDFLYVESKRARLEREKEERQSREDAVVEFSAEELALATIPGADFDPTRRHFSSDELRPQPIIRKRKKAYVDFEKKDGKYWEKRGKNNVAARRSREARRLKENQIALRTAYLESQNTSLKAAFQDVNAINEKLALEKKMLIEKLEKYESMGAFLG